MARIFLSYARADRNVAEQISVALESAGHVVWWDRHIAGGSEFATDIERELDSADVVLVIWSPDANQSSWVRDEAAVGRDQDKLVPVSLNEVVPPLGFRQFHAVNFSGWNGQDSAPEFKELERALTARLTGETVSAGMPLTRAAGHAGQESLTDSVGRAWRRIPWALGLLVAAGLAWLITANLPDRDTALQPPSADGPVTQTAIPTADQGIPRIAVDNIQVRGESSGLTDMAEVLAQEIATGLSRFTYWQVAARTETAAALSGQDAGNPLPVDYLLEATLLRSGSTLRLSAQLLKTSTGEQVWGETFSREYREENVLSIQDDLTDHLVASVADSYGALLRDLSVAVATKAPEDMTAYEAVLRQFVFRQRLGAEDHAVTRDALERAVELEPNYSNAWAALAGMYTEEYKHSYNPRPGSLDRALDAARRALRLEPDNAYANFMLAEVFYFRQDPGAFRASAERAIELNPRDSDAMAMIGILRCYAGDWEEGLALTRRAMSLNPNHPGWYRFGEVFYYLREQDYEAALASAQRINLPLYFADPYARTISHAYLGQDEQAKRAAQEFLALWTEGDMDWFREVHLERWFYASPELIELTLEGLQMAGVSMQADLEASE